MVTAVQKALQEVVGAYALVVSHKDHDIIVVARNTSPMVLGVGEGENFVASDAPALLPYTRKVIYLHDGDMALISKDDITVTDFAGNVLDRELQNIEWSAEAAEKDGHKHYMLKEMLEQPQVVQQTLGGRLASNGMDVQLDINLDPHSINRVVIAAAGTASYAGMVGEYLLEQIAHLPVEVELASEFRYREPVLDEHTLCIVVSQSGETIDTLEALREARRRGAKSLGIINAKGSSITREIDDVIYIHAGPEIGVASTKAYMAMLVAFELLAIWFWTCSRYS